MKEQIAKDLIKLLGREKVRHDKASLIAYSTDAGMYKLTPKAIVLVWSEDDVRETLRYAHKNNVPVTARAAGSSLTGGAIGEGIILDFVRLNKILEINTKEKWVRIQPGIIHDELNKELAKYSLMFAPDPASGDFCRLGGNLGNNASGPRSVKYGCTSHYVLELSIFLADGEKIALKEYEINTPQFNEFLAANPDFKKIYDLLDKNKELIINKKPKLIKNASGYNIFEVAEEIGQNKFNFAKLFVGNEGTLGIITEAKLSLVEVPKSKVTILSYFRQLEAAGKAATEILKLSPTAVEIMDSNSLNIVGRECHHIPLDAKAMLLVEFTDDSIEEKTDKTKELMQKYDLSAPVEVAFDPKEQETLWKIRKSILPALSRFDKIKKPLSFVEDTVVPTEKVPEMITFLDSISKKYNVPVASFGHIGDGNTHFNPIININDPEDFAKIQKIADEVNDKAIEFGGSITGEHGDGRVKGKYLKKLYGEEIYGIFKKIKSILDPENILNPGVKIAEEPLLKNIDFEKFKFQCSTCGKCNPVCPLFDILCEEIYGPRGRFRILNSKKYPFPESKEILDLCLGCKSCAYTCPAGADVADEVFEKRTLCPNIFIGLLSGVQRQKWLFGIICKIGAVKIPLGDSKFGRWFMEKLSLIPLKILFSSHAEINKNLMLPKPSAKTLRERYKNLIQAKSNIAYFYGCMSEFFEGFEGDAVIEVLNKNNIPVSLPEQLCCGVASISYGGKKDAKKFAKFNIEKLAGFEKIITSCASCHLALKEYPKLFSDEPQYKKMAEDVASKTYDISEFLIKFVNFTIPIPEKQAVPGQAPPAKVTYHDPCHHRVSGIIEEPRKLLKKIPGIEFMEMENADRCCGGAGTYNIKNFELSQKIFQKKRKAIESLGAEIVASSCPGCIIQIKTGMQNKIKVLHPIQLLAKCYEKQKN